MYRIVKIVAIGVGFGVMALIAQMAFNIDSDLIIMFYWIAAIVVVVGSIVINMLYYSKYLKRMQILTELLQKGQVEEFVTQVEQIIPVLKNSYLKNLYKINLTAGYCDLNEFQKAADLLEGMSDEKLQNILEDVYKLNLCAVYYYLGRNQLASNLFVQHQEVFNRLKDIEAYRGNIAILEIFHDIESGDTLSADEKFTTAKELYTNSRLQNDFQIIEKRLIMQNALLDQHDKVNPDNEKVQSKNNYYELS